MAFRIADLLATNHPCIFPPETTSFTAGRPCSERVRSRTFKRTDGDNPVPLRASGIRMPFAASAVTSRGSKGMVSRSNEARKSTVTKASWTDLQVETTEDSKEILLTPRTAETQKKLRGVVGLMSAAKGFFQHMRVSRPHNHFL